MDGLKDSTLRALEAVINDAEDLSHTQISQSTIDGALLITNELGQRTVMRRITQLAVNYLPKTVTKDVLFKRAQERFQDLAKAYADPSISAQWMYEDMSASCYCGCPADDFPDDVAAEQVSIIRYQYKDGTCFFIIDGIEVEVMDLRSMRESPRVNKETYADVCILTISYTDEDGNYMYHVIPNAWLYGSTSGSFDEGMSVHKQFIEAAHEYIKEHNITTEMQEVQN